jgi:hypothetical protein
MSNAPRLSTVRTSMSDRDVMRAISHFQYTFRQKTQHLQGRVVKKGSELYHLQTEFMYDLHELQFGYLYKRPQLMSKLNEFINSIQLPQPIETSIPV